MSTFQPPVHLDPTQDPAQQTAFINQNFQILATALETNSFRIVKSGTATGTTPSAGSENTITVAHNLGFTPIPLVFFSAGAYYYPLTAITAYGNGGSLVGIRVDEMMTASVDSTNLYITQVESLQSGNGGQSSSYQYYLLQQTAS